jgi:hypothetical protein
LHLAFEPSQRIFNGFAILKTNFRQTVHPPSGCNRLSIITYFRGYGDVSTVLRTIRKEVLSGERRADLRGLLRYEA